MEYLTLERKNRSVVTKSLTPGDKKSRFTDVLLSMDSLFRAGSFIPKWKRSLVPRKKERCLVKAMRRFLMMHDLRLF